VGYRISVAKFTITLKGAGGDVVAEIVQLATQYGLSLNLDWEDGDPVAAAVEATVAEVSEPRIVADSSPGKWAALLSILTHGQYDVLRVIASHPAGITAEKIGEKLGRGTSSITGSMGPGLLRNIPKAGYDIDEVLSIRDGRVKLYFPGPQLSNHLRP